MFMAYAGKMRWRTRMGDEMEARLGEGDTQDVTAQAWRTALDPKGEWMALGAGRRQHAAHGGGVTRSRMRVAS